MRPPSFTKTSIVFPFFLLVLSAVTAALKESSSTQDEDETKSLWKLDQYLPTSDRHLSPALISKRARATYITGGWTFIIGSTNHFNHIPSAASAMKDFYRFALDSLYDPENAAVQTRSLSISDETFEILFHIRDRWQHPDARLSIFMVRQFVTLMQYRAQRGLAAQYKGWLQGPGGVIIDVAMDIIPAAVLLDSAMDMYGDP
ncbi:MAG: hypothetical protein Q9209_005763 [Squamulea sp. 1 TL-2023]